MAEGRTDFKRADDDWYVEAVWVTTWLLKRERFNVPEGQFVLDPACGQGNILKACLREGLIARGSDTVQRMKGPAFLGRLDFLDEAFSPEPWAIICNPPYGRAELAEAFIRKAVTMPTVHKVAMLVNAKFLWGQGRSEGLFTDHPPATVYPINPRPSIPPGRFLLEGGKARGGVENFCWLVWYRHQPKTTLIKWSA